MPLTDDDYRNNCWLAVVVYLCDYGASPYTVNDPSTGYPWDFSLADDGNPPHPNPYIASWDIKSAAQPTSELLMASEDMSMISAAHAAIYGAKKSEVKALREVVARLTARVAEFAPLPSPKAGTPEPATAPSSRKSSLGDELGFDFLESES